MIRVCQTEGECNMGLKELRKQRGLTQRQLAEISGVNFRSLQDYEQGHKQLSSASGDILLRLATALNCSMEALLLSEDLALHGAPLLPKNDMTPEEINGQTFVSEERNIPGRWVCDGERVATVFYDHGQRYMVPSLAIFRQDLLPFLKDMGKLQIENAMDEIEFERRIGK